MENEILEKCQCEISNNTTNNNNTQQRKQKATAEEIWTKSIASKSKQKKTINKLAFDLPRGVRTALIRQITLME